MVWNVWIQKEGWFKSKTYPNLTDNGWMINLLDGSVKFFEGYWIALPFFK